ncbi:VOC family protein [Microbulbifer pacificus]|uniref:VOC family protein n=1 Tax=Microbulbifer pacificus TaxID=407164 RepID=A0AAU0N525_9GAMM|nr:VOC family protein [Microbulbifer pacificus]WOX07028.1 VOC family protein [Microbulbifer pacificus]
MTARVNHVGIAVPDLKKATKFFADVFGVTTVEVESDQVKNLYLKFENFTIQIMEDPGRLSGAPFGRLDHIAIDVDDLDETVKRLEGHDVQMAWDMPVRVEQYRSNFTTENGGVGVVFQISDEHGGDRPSQVFSPEMMDALARK